MTKFDAALAFVPFALAISGCNPYGKVVIPLASCPPAGFKLPETASTIDADIGPAEKHENKCTKLHRYRLRRTEKPELPRGEWKRNDVYVKLVRDKNCYLLVGVPTYGNADKHATEIAINHAVAPLPSLIFQGTNLLIPTQWSVEIVGNRDEWIRWCNALPDEPVN